MTEPLSPHYTALRSLFIVAMRRGIQLRPENFAEIDDNDSLGAVLGVMRSVGLRPRLARARRWADLVALEGSLPAMATRRSGHWVVITGLAAEGEPALHLLDPAAEEQGTSTRSWRDFAADWDGTLIVADRPAPPEASHFGLRWFLPEIARHAVLLREVAIAATMTGLISFATPLMFQILIDRVISHRGTQTLIALCVLFGVLMLFDGVFRYARQRIMLFVTTKIDARIASRVFAHLLSLPLTFFEGNTAGIVTRNLQQTEAIRQFLTGRLFQTLLDATALPFMLLLLFLYSAKLTAVVLLISGAMAALIGLMLPVFRRHLEQLYQAEGARQSHLVETVHGMRTVKTLAMEAVRLRGWDEKVAAGVARRASVGKISAIADVLTTSLDKTMQIAILALGALDIFDGRLSIGALVAFNMIAGRVTGPLIQIVALINDYQQTALAVKMLGTVMRHPPERDPAQSGLTPPIDGALEFDDVSFRYAGAPAPTLDRVNFTIPRGQVVGVVGRSGSGKTTVTRLIQGINAAQSGTIRFDGIDMRQIDLAHLRRSIGVVLQDNFLFRGTVRENIAAARPDAPLAEIAAAARLAGADEFIDRLPAAYDHGIEENGANFSGGQRQRIAIARSLLNRPRLLIFDEATSALDPESEAIVQSRLRLMAQGRTLIIVSHRLATLTGADAILVFERGVAVDCAPHAELLRRCGVYQKLWGQQVSA